MNQDRVTEPSICRRIRKLPFSCRHSDRHSGQRRLTGRETASNFDRRGATGHRPRLLRPVAARVAELVDALRSGRSKVYPCGSSSLPPGTTFSKARPRSCFFILDRPLSAHPPPPTDLRLNQDTPCNKTRYATGVFTCHAVCVLHDDGGDHLAWNTSKDCQCAGWTSISATDATTPP